MARWWLAALILSLASPVFSEELKKDEQDFDALTKKMTEIAKPGAEHKKLESLAGNWNYTCKFWMDPSKPPMESSGTIERKWILGYRFLEEKVAGTGFDGKSDFEGRGVMGYDNAEKKFTAGWVCNMCTSVSTSLGTYDDSSKQFTFHKEEFCPLKNKKVKARDEIRIESNDKHVMEAYQLDDGKEVKVMELVCTRQK